MRETDRKLVLKKLVEPRLGMSMSSCLALCNCYARNAQETQLQRNVRFGRMADETWTEKKRVAECFSLAEAQKDRKCTTRFLKCVTRKEQSVCQLFFCSEMSSTFSC